MELEFLKSLALDLGQRVKASAHSGTIWWDKRCAVECDLLFFVIALSCSDEAITMAAVAKMTSFDVLLAALG